ncbi:hypothetical protein Bbelb_260720 [Branchiostoma belcheri]|nr:hypothetical protein Bbelb_260720 [Branchiostoma belcheri]
MEAIATEPVTSIPAITDVDSAKPSAQESLALDFKLSSEKPRSKVGRACLVSGYLLVISLGAIVLVVYYGFFWGGDAALFPSSGVGVNATSAGSSGGGGGGLGGDGGGGNGGGSDGGSGDGGGGDGGGGDGGGGDGDDGGGEGGTATAASTSTAPASTAEQITVAQLP